MRCSAGICRTHSVLILQSTTILAPTIRCRPSYTTHCMCLASAARNCIGEMPLRGRNLRGVRTGLLTILTTMLVWLSQAHASGPIGVTLTLFRSVPLGDRAIRVRIENRSSETICLARDFSGPTRLTASQTGTSLEPDLPVRDHSPPGCSLMPPGDMVETYFNLQRLFPKIKSGYLRACYTAAWRADSDTSRDPDLSAQHCQTF